MQKARPYGRCLLAIPRRLPNGPRGHALTPATAHRKETAIIYAQPVRKVAREPYGLTVRFQRSLHYETSVVDVYGNPAAAFFHADNKVYLPTRHVLGLQSKQTGGNSVSCFYFVGSSVGAGKGGGR